MFTDNSNRIQYAFEEGVLKNPSKVYKELRARIAKYGNTTPMPEFEGIVEELLTALNNPFLSRFIEHARRSEDPVAYSFVVQRDQAMIGLYHVSELFVLPDEVKAKGYPHRPPFEGRYPYRATLEAIATAIQFFEAFDRTTHANNIPRYHTDRYTHYALSLADSDMIVLPSTRPLSLRDLIRMRSYPLALLGITTKTIFADARFNSPEDFRVHDANHNRRFHSYNSRYCEKQKCSLDEACERFEKTITEVILPSIDIKPGMTKEEQDLQKMKAAVYFEFLHEFAYTPTMEDLKEALQFRYGDPAPFEIMKTGTAEDNGDVEQRRMDNNNIQSGFLRHVRGKATTSPEVHYFFDKVGPNFLTTLHNKLTTRFYDNQFFQAEELPALEDRTPELIAKAALAVMKDFGIDPAELNLNEERLAQLARNEDEHGKSYGKLSVYPNNKLEKPRFKESAVDIALGKKEPGAAEQRLPWLDLSLFSRKEEHEGSHESNKRALRTC
ncbi:TPA: hypothetical protein ACT9LE_002731 [Legionella pneumophila]